MRSAEFFEVRDNHKQDNKTWVVLYLNRLYCAHYDLVVMSADGSEYLSGGFKIGRMGLCPA